MSSHIYIYTALYRIRSVIVSCGVVGHGLFLSHSFSIHHSDCLQLVTGEIEPKSPPATSRLLLQYVCGAVAGTTILACRVVLSPSRCDVVVFLARSLRLSVKSTLCGQSISQKIAISPYMTERETDSSITIRSQCC